jgi:hypothetical protein
VQPAGGGLARDELFLLFARPLIIEDIQSYLSPMATRGS